MIRRFYILPLKHNVSDAKVNEFLQALSDADRFIPGLLDSAAAVDFDSRTVLWENTFIDEETYTGLYMVHPYHIGALDTYVMADSPECVTQDIYTARYASPGSVPRLEKGIRRVVLLKLAEGVDTSPIEALSDKPRGMATSVFCPDNVGWRSPKGLSWTHIWEQGFTDIQALDRFLGTRDGVLSSSREGIRRLGVDVDAIKILTCPFELKPAQTPAAMSAESFPTFYNLTARMALNDADAYIGLLEELYDPSIADSGGKLVHRWRTVEDSMKEAEVESTWELDSVAAYSDFRLKTFDEERWNRFVREAMPMVTGGRRRFYRAV